MNVPIPRSGFVAVASLLATGCLHPSNNDGAGAINLARAGDYLLVALGEGGLDVVRLEDEVVVHHEAPSGLASSFDDVSVWGSVVVALDADDGRLVRFDLDEGGALTRRGELDVASGPYSGVALASTVAVVSGGTCGTTLVSISSGGELTVRETFRVARGQPEVSVEPSGTVALLSTHFSGNSEEFVDGAEFGVSLLELETGAILDTAGLPGAGFTEGGGTPASWPVRATFSASSAFVAHGGGLTELTLDAGRIEVVRTLPLEGPLVDVALAGPRAFVLLGAPPSIVEVDLERWEVIGSRGVPGDEPATALVATTGRLFVAGNESGLLSLER